MNSTFQLEINSVKRREVVFGFALCQTMKRFCNVQKHNALCSGASPPGYGYALLAVANEFSFSFVPKIIHFVPLAPNYKRDCRQTKAANRVSTG
jgi:hypothetical protein